MTIRELIKRSGMTQRNFAEYFGIPQRTIERWVSSKNTCSDYRVNLMLYKLYKEGIVANLRVAIVDVNTDTIISELQFDSLNVTVDEIFDTLGIDYEYDDSYVNCAFELKRGKRTGRCFTLRSKRVCPEGVVADTTEYGEFQEVD